MAVRAGEGKCTHLTIAWWGPCHAEWALTTEHKGMLRYGNISIREDVFLEDFLFHLFYSFNLKSLPLPQRKVAEEEIKWQRATFSKQVHSLFSHPTPCPHSGQSCCGNAKWALFRPSGVPVIGPTLYCFTCDADEPLDLPQCRLLDHLWTFVPWQCMSVPLLPEILLWAALQDLTSILEHFIIAGYRPS